MAASRYLFCLCTTVFVLSFADGRSVCPEVGCARFCKSGFVLKNGCPTCQCIDPCEDAGVLCNATQRCNVTQIPEPHLPEIDPVFDCVPRCPEKKCAKDCGFYGYALDSNNCQTCQCIDPCENAGIICNATQRCKEPLMVGQGVEGASNPDFNLEPECCSEWKCARYCESGYALDSNGCPTCQCISPCENAGIICNATQRCKEIQISEPHTPELDPQLECVPFPQCGPACDIVCEYGHVLDENDCPTCECEDPCRDLSCLEPKVCVPRPVFCFLPPCYPVPTCCTPLLTCDLSCPNGYAINSDGCQICQCKQIISTRAP